MKRQRVVSVSTSEATEMAAAAKKKKAIGKVPVTATDHQKAVEVVEKKKDMAAAAGTNSTDQGTVTGNFLVNNWDEKWPNWIGDFVDEQMSWGSVWFPFWDMDFSDAEAFGAFYGDVVLDDDIWDLKKEIPNPFQG